jgi:hypothetical protein
MPATEELHVRVTLDVIVDDKVQLARAALVRAVENGMTGNEYRHMRRSSGVPGYVTDVQWLLDSTPDNAGMQIDESGAEPRTLQFDAA